MDKRHDHPSPAPTCPQADVWAAVESLCLRALCETLDPGAVDLLISKGVQQASYDERHEALLVAGELLRSIERAQEYGRNHPFSILRTLMHPISTTEPHLRAMVAKKSGRGRRPAPRTWLVLSRDVIENDLSDRQIAALALLVQIRTNNTPARHRAGRNTSAHAILNEEAREVRKARKEPNAAAEIAFVREQIETDQRHKKQAEIRAAFAKGDPDEEAHEDNERPAEDDEETSWREIRGK